MPSVWNGLVDIPEAHVSTKSIVDGCYRLNPTAQAYWEPSGTEQTFIQHSLDLFESRLRDKVISRRSERNCCEQSKVQVASHQPSIRNSHISLPQDERSNMHWWLYLPLDD